MAAMENVETRSDTNRPLPGFLAGLLVFFTAGSVLVVELTSVRVMAPFVGVTLQTYTVFIATVLAGISCGTWLGGKLADRVGARPLLGPLLLLGALFC